MAIFVVMGAIVSNCAKRRTTISLFILRKKMVPSGSIVIYGANYQQKAFFLIIFGKEPI